MEDTLRILILEDVEDDVGLVEHVLRKSGMVFELKRVDTREEFKDAILRFEPSVILSDHSLPQFNSIEALNICLRLRLVVPFILVTGSVSEEFAVTCLKQGADDYVLKSNLARLPSAIENALRHRRHISQQKKAEEELRAQFEELVKVNREIDNFVYSVSHNIRSPLASVLGLLDLVKRDDAQRDNYFHTYFEMMSKSVKKLDDTLNEILDYSRNSRGEVQFQEINIRALIEESFDRLKYLKGHDQITRNISITQEQPLYSDTYRLSIIFSNLISNAIRYRDATKKESKINISVLVQQEQTVITIEDNGVGIETALLPRIYDMFFRASQRSDGAGLGLYIVKETVIKLRGEIKIDSHLGTGTFCKIKLPTR